MSTAFRILMTLCLISGVAAGQFKSKGESRASVNESLIRSDDGLILGWFDPSRFTMHQCYSLSVSSLGGGQSMSVGMYTNSMYYQFSDPLSVQFDVSLMHTPFNSFGDKFSKDFSGLYLTRAQLNYRPSSNMLFQIQYRQLPALYWLNNYGSGGFFNGLDRYEQEEKR